MENSKVRCFIRKIRKTYHAAFSWAGISYTQSLQTEDEAEAEIRLGPIRDTLYRLERGTLHIPVEAEPKAFILSSGQQARKPQSVATVTVNALAARFAEWSATYYVKHGKPTNQVRI